jgi:hypothetical protein
MVSKERRVMIFMPEQWEKPTPEEMLGFLDRPKAEKGKPTGSILVFRKHLSPLAVYKYLIPDLCEKAG